MSEGIHLPSEVEAALIAESVEQRLLTYLLDPDHREGGSKAAWFRRALGFTRENYPDLAAQIVYDPNGASAQRSDSHGVRLEQLVTLHGANGRTIADVRLYWIREPDGRVRLLTIKPPKKRR
jgi:filamentous hemagglutinin